MRLIALLSLCLAAVSAPALAAPSIQEAEAAALALAMTDSKTPAMAVIEIRAGQAQPEAVRGVRRMDRPDPVRPGDRWHIGSDTKAMTATLVASLVDEGRLSWTARLDEMLPELAAGMRPEYRGATLPDLLSHYSGLPENIADEASVLAYHDDQRPLPEQRLDYVKRALAEAPVAPPRTKRSYSNTGFILAGVIAERAGGKPYEQLMRERVFAPLGMDSPSFEPAAEGEPVGHVDGRLARRDDVNPPMINPAGGVRMSLPDWARFCIDQLNGPKGQGKLLKPETYRFMQTAQGENGGAGWAFGWGVAPTVMGRKGPALTHSGSDGNWYAIVALLPESGNGVLVAANAAESMGGDKATVTAARALAADLAPPKPADPAAAKPAS